MKHKSNISCEHDKDSAGLHACIIYSDDQERCTSIVRFIKSVLAQNNTFLYVADSAVEAAPAWISKAITQSEQFTAMKAREVYCPKNEFVPGEMVGQIRALCSAALEQGFSRFAGSGEMSWVTNGWPGSERLIEYELLLNELVEECETALLCQYDVNKFDGGTILDILRVHPMVLVNGQVLNNPFFRSSVDTIPQMADQAVLNNRVLSELLLAQGMLYVFKSKKTIGEFIAKIIMSVPGCNDCKVSLLESPFLRTDSHKLNNEAGPGAELAGLFKTISKNERSYSFSLAVAGRSYGAIDLEIDSEVYFEIYRPYIQMLVSSVATTLANRWQQQELEKTAKELIAASDTANTANKIKTQFLANMSHEIRTPLNAVIGLTDVLLFDKDLNKDQKEILQTIQDSGDDLLAVVNDILDFSKVEAGKIQVEEVSFDICKLLGRVYKLMKPKVDAKKLSLLLTANHTSLFVKGDEHRIYQVLVNLLSNAIKFTNEGSIEMHLAAKEINQRTLLLNVGIKDTGKGISKEAQLKIFEDFEQEDMSTTRQFGGTGLGLSISRRLVRLMGGEIYINSELDKGSNFYFELPLEKGDQVVRAQEKIKVALVASEARQIRVLVVEDNKLNARVVNDFLKKQGCVIEIAENGQIACDLLERISYDLVLMDMQMPVMGGVEATGHIRQRESRSEARLRLPIIAMTANVMDEHKEECLNVGMDDFITKPIKFEILTALINKWVSN